MRRLLFVLVAAVCSLGLGAYSALADSPHFLYANSSVSSSTGALTVSFKEAGLGSTVSSELITVTVNNATALYQCFNNGGNHPKAGNKETVSTSLTTSGTFPVRNGQTTGSLTVGPPGPGGFSCPPGQTLFLTSVTYTGIFVSGAGASREASPDPISSGPILIG